MVKKSGNAFESLQALRRGELDQWHGISPGCQREVVEQVFGNTGPGPDGAATLGDDLLAFRDYPASRFAPHGFTVWYVGDVVYCVQVNLPNMAKPLEQILGAPEIVTPSRLKSFHEQWIYAKRGLTAHVKSSTRNVFRLYFYAPTNAEDFLQSSLSRVEIRRTPVL